MNRERWQRIETLFQGALDRPAAQRAAWLDAECTDDRALRVEVLALLAEHDTDPEFLEPLVELAAAGSGIPADETEGREPKAESRHIGPYRIVREVGAGGMGVVYLAMHEGPGFERPVALKVIRRGLDTEELLHRFQLERRILAALKHPNVAHLIDAGQTPDGRPFFVMEFVEGVPIDAYCEQRRLDVRQRLHLFRQVCDAVQHAHNNLVVHRDLKPGNILVAGDGTPVLLDFGIGKLLDPGASEPSTTRTGARAFTPEYASPEQLRGEPVSTATDVYGLGLLLYQLLTGRRPFQPSTGYAFEKAVMETDPERPSVHGGRQLAGDLDTIVLKALRKEPQRRYSSVAALADDVQRHLDGLPVRARGERFAYVAGKFVRRNRVALGAAAMVFLSLITATTYSVFQARAVARERDKALEVQSFLLEMLGAGGRGRADSVSVRQLLDGQAAQVPLEYADRPELHSQMLYVIAEGYDRLGLLTQAEPLAREALEIRRSALRPNHPDIAASVSLLGWITHEQGRSDSGEALLREARALWSTARPANPLQFSRTLNDLGVVRESRGKYDEAAQLYRQALAIRRALPGPNDRQVGTTASNLSVVLFRLGDYRAAVAQAETALTLMRRSMGPDHQRSTLIQGNLAAFRYQLGDFAGAESEYRDVTARQVRVLGREHPVTAGSMAAHSTVLRALERYAEAESLLVQVLATYQAVYGPEHARVATALMQLGGTRSSMRRFGEARPLIERALAIQRKLRGENHRDVAQALSTLGALHADAGNWAEAERFQRQAVDIYERVLGEGHIEAGLARARLARATLRRGRPAESYALYRETHDAMVAAGMQRSANLRDVRLGMAQALVALDRDAEADSVIRVASDSGASRSQRALIDSLRARLRSGR